MADRSLDISIDNFCELAGHFQSQGAVREARRFGSGHINDTFLVSFDGDAGPVRHIFQRINHNVFKNVRQLMENISRVTAHLASKGDRRSALTLVPTLVGEPYYETPNGEFWRVYLYVEGARTYDRVENPRQAFEAARAFGGFQEALADLPGARLHESIPHFHDTPWRVAALRKAAEADVAGRKKEVLPELEFALQREADAGRLLNLARLGQIPERVTHNDTKLNNVMLDEKTGEGICVIDLDTVMPGLSLCDFGDMVRFAANTGAEDEVDLMKVDVALPVFEAIAEGYIESAGSILTKVEWENLVFSARLITYEIGIRFLTDYLQGDIYFRIKYPEHNLVRARSQFRLVDRMEAAGGAMEAIVRRLRLGGL